MSADEQPPVSGSPRRTRLPLVAIVGRPNVGKSTLFNRLVGRHAAIVEPTAGVTRDRHYERVTHYDKPFLLVDTGGIGLAGLELDAEVSEQTRLAIEEADLTLFVIDAGVGLTAVEREIFGELRKKGADVLVVANKTDVKGAALQAAELHELGVGEAVLTSAEHGKGLNELIDAVEARLPEPEGEVEPEALPEECAVAVVGRPNVGKSTLINRLLGEERLVVSPIAGTTRDPIDTHVAIDGKPYLFIDTAGVRRKSRISLRLERFSVLAAFRAVERAEIVLLVFDADEGLTEQDRKIAGLVEDAGRALIFVANKWDLKPRGAEERRKFEDRVRYLLPEFRWAPLVEISAEKGEGLQRLLREVERVKTAYRAEFATSYLNRVLEEIVEHRPPPAIRGRPIKINYIHQIVKAPPGFLLYTNVSRDFPRHYRRYLANQLRERLDLECVPVHLKFKSKHADQKK